MKKIFHSLFALAALALVASCGSDDDPAPQTPAYLTQGTDSRPTTWTAPTYRDYELTMSVQVQLGDTLAYFQSAGDLMSATIGGEVRAVAQPQTTAGVTYYALTIAGNGDDATVDLHYYCDRLHRLFTLNNWSPFAPSAAPTGDSGIYRPAFTSVL